MADMVSALQPAIDVLENDLADLERQANGLLTSINVLRARAGLPPRSPGGGWSPGGSERSGAANATPIKLHSDTFTGKKLGSAVRQYLEMRKASGTDAPATAREIFDALKHGGFVSGAKDDTTAMVVLRTMLRKNTTVFAKLSNSKYGLRAWYPNLRQPKGASISEGAEEAASEVEAEPEDAAVEAAATPNEGEAAAA